MGGAKSRLVKVDRKGRIYLPKSFAGDSVVLVVENENTVILKRAKVEVTIVGDKKKGRG